MALASLVAKVPDGIASDVAASALLKEQTAHLLINVAGSVYLTRPMGTHLKWSYDELSWRSGEFFEAIQDGTITAATGERYRLSMQRRRIATSRTARPTDGGVVRPWGFGRAPHRLLVGTPRHGAPTTAQDRAADGASGHRAARRGRTVYRAGNHPPRCKNRNPRAEFSAGAPRSGRRPSG